MLRMLGTILLRRWVLLFFIPSALVQSQGSTNGGQLPPKFVEMMNTQVSWDLSFGKPAGPRLRFVKISSPDTGATDLTRYRVFADGAQEKTPYIFAVWKIGTYLDNLQVLSSGAYVNRKDCF